MAGGGARAGAAVAEGLLTPERQAWVKRELERWAREPPTDEDVMLSGDWVDWSFRRVFDTVPRHVSWCLENPAAATRTEQERRFLKYVEGRLAAMEEHAGAGSAAGRAQEGVNRAPGEASAPGRSSSEDGPSPDAGGGSVGKGCTLHAVK